MTTIKRKNPVIKSVTTESVFIKWTFITTTILFLGIILLITLLSVFKLAFSKGYDFFWNSVTAPDTLYSIKLTFITTAFSLLFNTLFGIAAAWLITKYDFRWKNILITLLDLPYTISPVIAGMMFVLFLGSNSFVGGLLNSFDIKIIFAVPGIIIVTTFVTFPYVARELIPHMIESGREEEEAALSLGSGGFKMFFKVTLPNIKWSLLYGMILCNARAIGEFGAVSVVSGHIRGLTNTMPLQIEMMYNEYNFAGAFAVASLLTLFALFTLFIKSLIEIISHKVVT
jgi:sulfate transport system permease protein